MSVCCGICNGCGFGFVGVDMIGFTMGKWTAKRHDMGVFIYCERDYLIAQIVDRPEAEHNKSLIAAAPDMYEALDTLVAVIGLTAFKYEGQRQVLQEAVDLSVAALKKARGEI